MKLLIAADSVVTAEMLVGEVTSRAWTSGTRARVLSVVEDDEVPAEVWREWGYTAEAVRQEMKRRSAQISAVTIEPLRRAGIPADVVIMRGDPGSLIGYAARSWSADLIFIREHNRIGFRRWLLGSVARAVTRSAPCPVEVVRATSDEVRTNVVKDRDEIPLATSDSESLIAAGTARIGV